MKYTLLDMVQLILSSMDSDEVNSITDTTEAMQVANLIKSTYDDIVVRAQLPRHFSMFSLTPSTDDTLPTVMYVPETVSSVKWVKYDTHLSTDTTPRYTDMDYLDTETFLARMFMLNNSDSNVGTASLSINGNSIPLLYRNDLAPACYTSFDDKTLIFDAIDLAVDTTLQSDKTVCWGRMVSGFDLIDTFIPDLNEDQFPLLINESKALAWAELKQTQHARAERSARLQWAGLQNDKDRGSQMNAFNKLPNYGRRR